MTQRPDLRPLTAAVLLLLAPSLALASGQTGGQAPSEPPLVDVEEADTTEAPPQTGRTGKPAPAAAVEKTATPAGALVARDEEATVLARAELVVGQGLNGFTHATTLCAAAACNSAQAFAGSALLGAGLGVALAAMLTGDGISGGPAQVINSGAAWGLFDGLMFSMLMAGQIPNSQAMSLTISLTGLAGTGVGAFLAYKVRPIGGDVAMINSGGMWGAAIAAMVMSSSLSSFTPQGFATVELIAAHGGMLAMGLVSTQLKMSRGRMFLIDAGGMLGILLGFTTWTFAGMANSGTTLGPIAAVGAIAGLAAGYALTSGIDEGPDVRVALVPMLGGGRDELKGAALLASF